MQRKTIIIVALLALVLVGMIVAVFTFRQPIRPVPVSTGDTNAPTPIDESDPLAALLSACDSQERPDACRDGIRFQEAVKAGESGYCAAISVEASRYTCYQLVALQGVDVAACDAIADAVVKEGCVAQVMERQARLNPDITPCAARTAELQLECLVAAFSNLTTEDMCERYSDDGRTACAEYFDFRQAADARDAVACQASAGRFRPLCAEYVPVAVSLDPTGDPDGDGLLNAEEERYGSNPFQTDSDSDGYGDADEVKNGYNPNGPGRLP